MPGRSKLSNGFDFTAQTHHDSYAFIDSASKSDLSGKYVVVTGASKGVGRALALAYAKAGAAGIGIGARSDLASLEGEIQKATQALGKPTPRVCSFSLDVEDEGSVDKAAQAIRASFPQLDILVNNAGYLEPFAPLASSEPADWWKTWAVNIRGLYLNTRANIPFMTTAPGTKQIINITSMGAHSQTPGASAYETTKLATMRLSEFINTEYGRKGFLSYAVHPGGIKTDLASNFPKAMTRFLIDTPEMAADTIVWLTQDSRDWLKGRYVSCNWDMQELLAMMDEIVQKDLLKVRMAVQ